MRTSLPSTRHGAVVALTLALSAEALALGAGSAAASTRHSSPAPLIVKSVKHGTLGTVLETAKGYTLYHFTKDASKKLACLTGCVSAWPPLMLPKGLSHATAGKGVVQTYFGKIARGKNWQVTYKGQPLYTYSADSGPGQTHGQGVGGTWFVVKAVPTATRTPSPTNTTGGGYGY